MDYDKLATQLGGTVDAGEVDYDALATKFGGTVGGTDEAPQEQAPLMDRLGRQAGLTGRTMIEGAAELGGLIYDPVAGAMNETIGTDIPSLASQGRGLSDAIGLPSPENGTERVVSGASKFLIPTAGFVKGGQTLSNAGVKGAELLASRPGMQAVSAMGAGASGALAKENGAGPGGEFAASLAGGIAAPVAASTIQNAGKSALSTIQRFLGQNQSLKQADMAFRQAGINLNEFPIAVRKQLAADVDKALKETGNLSPSALRNLADYRATGLTPMRSNLTLNAGDVTREQNLMKMSANSADPSVQALANNRNANNAQLINKLNEAGAGQADDAVVAGGKLISALQSRDTAAKGTIGKLYEQARTTDGRSARLNNTEFTNRANDLLDEKLLGGKLPSDVRNLLNKTATGEQPLTVDVAEQFKTRIGELQRASTDPAERMALSQVRQALEDTPLIDGQGQKAINAFNKARRANRAYMNVVEKTPALKAVRDGIEPDKFVEKFVTGKSANIADLENLRRAVKTSPDALESVRTQMIQYLKTQAIGEGVADEVAKVSQSGLNKALSRIGDAKLSIFFGKPELENLKRLGRVASFEQFQPAGSAVNNSNTAAANFSYLIDRIADNKLIRSLPFGEVAITGPAKNAATALGARRAMNPSKALALPAPKAPKEPKLPLAAIMGASTAFTE